MRFLRHALLVATIAGAAVVGSACDNTTAPDLNWQLGVVLTNGSNRPGVGDTTQLRAYILPNDDEASITAGIEVTSRVTWSVVGPAGVVTVSDSGLVTALAPGAVSIRASYGDRDASASFVVE